MHLEPPRELAVTPPQIGTSAARISQQLASPLALHASNSTPFRVARHSNAAAKSASAAITSTTTTARKRMPQHDVTRGREPFAYWARWDGERTLEGRRQEQIQASSGRASSYWNGHSSASASSGSSPSNPSSVSAAHSAAPLILAGRAAAAAAVVAVGGCSGGLDWSGGWAAVRGRQRLLCLRCVSSKQREQNKMGSADCWGMGFRWKLENSDRSPRGLAIGFRFSHGLKLNGLYRGPCVLAGGPPFTGTMRPNKELKSRSKPLPTSQAIG